MIIWMKGKDWIFIEHLLESQKFYKYNPVIVTTINQNSHLYLHFMTKEIALKSNLPSNNHYYR